MIVNLQRKVKVETRDLTAFAERLTEAVSEAAGATFSVAFVSDRKMTELNKLFRDKDSTTDVLSFPHEADEFETHEEHFLGDIVISAEQAAKQAEENGLSLEGEIKQLILHGLLHLCGYNHEADDGEMESLELELRDRLGI